MEKHLRPDGCRLPVYKAAKRLRDVLGYDVNRMATEIGVHSTVWGRLEAGSVNFSTRTLGLVRDVTGIDLYVLAYFLYADTNHLPESVRKLHGLLRDEWELQLNRMLEMRRKLPLGWPMPGAK